jgi:hypothetical protein
VSERIFECGRDADQVQTDVYLVVSFLDSEISCMSCGPYAVCSIVAVHFLDICLLELSTLSDAKIIRKVISAGAFT